MLWLMVFVSYALREEGRYRPRQTSQRRYCTEGRAALKAGTETREARRASSACPWPCLKTVLHHAVACKHVVVENRCGSPRQVGKGETTDSGCWRLRPAYQQPRQANGRWPWRIGGTLPRPGPAVQFPRRLLRRRVGGARLPAGGAGKKEGRFRETHRDAQERPGRDGAAEPRRFDRAWGACDQQWLHWVTVYHTGV